LIHGLFARSGFEQRFFFHQIFVYEAGDGQRTKLHEGAVDGIGTDLGKFWIKDADGKKLVDQTPALPTRAVAFKMVSDALHSGDFPAPAAIGHRMVCGGPTVQENQLITPELIDEMELYTAFAPLHTPIACYIMRESLRLFPSVPNFVCLDSYFHRTMPEVVTHMPIPEEYSAMGVRRYGAHGISYESIVYQLQPHVPKKLIVAHLGNGAVHLRHSRRRVPGHLHGPHSHWRHHQRYAHRRHRSGRAVVYSAQNCRDREERLRCRRSTRNGGQQKGGLLGVSDLSNDMRDLREAIKAGNAKGAAGRGQVHLDHRPLDRQLRGGVERTGHAGSSPAASAKKRHRRSRGNLRGAERAGHRPRPRAQQRPRPAVISSEHSPVTVRVIPPAEGFDDRKPCGETDGVIGMLLLTPDYF